MKQLTAKDLKALTKVWLELYVFYYLLGAIVSFLMPCIYSKAYRKKVIDFFKNVCAKSVDMTEKSGKYICYKLDQMSKKLAA